MAGETQTKGMTELTVDLLAGYLAHNNVRSEDIPALIQSTYSALKSLEEAPAVENADAVADPEHTPAVTARKSLANPDQIISMIDGKAYKVLTRHLTTHGLTPQQYRQRYNLPRDYPMVARNYAERRRELAHAIGLGRKPRGGSAPAAPVEVAPKPARKPRAKAASKP